MYTSICASQRPEFKSPLGKRINEVGLQEKRIGFLATKWLLFSVSRFFVAVPLIIRLALAAWAAWAARAAAAGLELAVSEASLCLIGTSV